MTIYEQIRIVLTTAHRLLQIFVFVPACIAGSVLFASALSGHDPAREVTESLYGWANNSIKPARDGMEINFGARCANAPKELAVSTEAPPSECKTVEVQTQIEGIDRAVRSTKELYWMLVVFSIMGTVWFQFFFRRTGFWSYFGFSPSVPRVEATGANS